MLYDLVIIGAGPAGLTAAVYAARKKLNTLIISENIGGQTLLSAGIENYLGYQHITGAELIAKFEQHVAEFGVDKQFATIVSVTKTDRNTFLVKTADSKEFEAEALIIASGKSPRKLNVPGEEEFLGKGVDYCATCDAPVFAGKEVAVIGGGNAALEAAFQLAKITPKVYLISIGKLAGDEITQEKLKKEPNVSFYLGYNTTKIVGDKFVTGLTVEETKTSKSTDLKVEGVFVEIGWLPNSGIVKDLVELNERNEIVINCAAQTSMPGIFAAGDVASTPDKQVIIAAGDGAKATLSAYRYLLTHK